MMIMMMVKLLHACACDSDYYGGDSNAAMYMCGW